jgi:hypothetical protein
MFFLDRNKVEKNRHKIIAFYTYRKMGHASRDFVQFPDEKYYWLEHGEIKKVGPSKAFFYIECREGNIQEVRYNFTTKKTYGNVQEEFEQEERRIALTKQDRIQQRIKSGSRPYRVVTFFLSMIKVPFDVPSKYLTGCTVKGGAGIGKLIFEIFRYSFYGHFDDWDFAMKDTPMPADDSDDLAHWWIKLAEVSGMFEFDWQNLKYKYRLRLIVEDTLDVVASTNPGSLPREFDEVLSHWYRKG